MVFLYLLQWFFYKLEMTHAATTTCIMIQFHSSLSMAMNQINFQFFSRRTCSKTSRRVLPMMSKRRSSISLKCSGEQFSGMMRNKLQYKHFSIACRVFVCVAMSKINCNPLSTSTYSWERLSKLFLRRLVVRKKLPQINFSFYYRFVYDRVPFLRFFLL